MENCDIFLIFPQNIDCGYMRRSNEYPQSMFKSKKGKICRPQFCYMSRVVRKPAFCICENKDADQLRGNREADQRLCFRYTDSTIPLLSIYEISML